MRYSPLRSQIDPSELKPEYSGILYLNIQEIAGVPPATKARVELLNNFHVKSPRTAVTVGPPQAPAGKGHAVRFQHASSFILPLAHYQGLSSRFSKNLPFRLVRDQFHAST